MAMIGAFWKAAMWAGAMGFCPYDEKLGANSVAPSWRQVAKWPANFDMLDDSGHLEDSGPAWSLE
jgi:hypothetical protein